MWEQAACILSAPSVPKSHADVLSGGRMSSFLLRAVAASRLANKKKRRAGIFKFCPGPERLRVPPRPPAHSFFTGIGPTVINIHRDGSQ